PLREVDGRPAGEGRRDAAAAGRSSQAGKGRIDHKHKLQTGTACQRQARRLPGAGRCRDTKQGEKQRFFTLRRGYRDHGDGGEAHDTAEEEATPSYLIMAISGED